MLNLTYMKFFYDAADNKSISTSARLNFVTQSAISQGISKLEKALGVVLTTHQKHLFKLTYEGEIVFQKLREVFRNIHEMENLVHATSKTISGPVRYLCPPSIALSYILPALTQLKKEHPLVEPLLKVGSIPFIHTMLRQGLYDFALVVGTEGFEAFDQITIYEGTFNLYQTSKKLLDTEGIYVDSRNGYGVKELSSYKIKEELDSWEVVARFAHNGLGCGFLPDFILLDKRYPHLKKSHAKLPTIPYTISAVLPKGQTLSRAAKTFIDLLYS